VVGADKDRQGRSAEEQELEQDRVPVDDERAAEGAAVFPDERSDSTPVVISSGAIAW
jgi:hypothetical protein